MKQKESHIYLGAAAVTIAAFLISLYVGKYNLTLREIFQICTGAVHEGMARNVFFTLRLPRTIMALLAGFGLSMAGAVYQNIFKNPLAAPDLIGAMALLRVLHFQLYAFMGGRFWQLGVRLWEA